MPHQVSRSLANETATLLVIPAVAVSLVAAQFAPVPSHQSGRAAAADVVALVNGAAIRAGDVEAAMNTIVPMTAYHQSLKPEKLASVRTQAIDGLIDEELRYQEAVRLKIHVPDADVDLAFARAKKSYHDEQEFERLRKASGATVAQIRASILRALMIQRVYEQAVGGRCRVSEAEAGAFYRDNTARFLMPEQLKVSLITVGVDPSAPADDWEKARQKARDVSQRLAGGASFEALARESSTDESKSKGGDLGFVHRGQLAEDFERALRQLTPGHISPVIQTIYGFHLLRLADVRPPVQKTFADVKTTIVRDLTETRCAQQAADWSKGLRARAHIVIAGGEAAAAAPVAAAAPRK
ncbi:MAG TPA: peptidylprolyl isomerase [Vicinamibacterales bacterium]|nr:peptidylprolyl isomerase [Vicinamibacterales bacterium]